jgi:hypothetical protein
MAPNEQIKVLKVVDGAKAMDDGTFAKILVYEFMVGKHGPFREEFFANEQNPDTINFRLNARARLLRETTAFMPEGT